jgi:hypothetical protein
MQLDAGSPARMAFAAFHRITSVVSGGYSYDNQAVDAECHQHPNKTHILTQAHPLWYVILIVPELQEQIVGDEMRD